jgi:3-oxoacyl-[acyl-carrier protein] reductase
MPGEFAGKVVVVTGGSRGIGRQIAVDFAREGAQTVIVSSSEANLAAATKTVAAAGGPAPLAIAADLRKLDGCETVFKRVQDKFKRCDILVNCAGATKAGNFVDLPDEAWMDGYALKLFGCVRMCRLFWPLLKAAQGHVVNIIGGAARTPGADFTIGGSVNAAMGNFSKSLSQLGKKDGVNVNAIHPGVTDTERLGELLDMRSRASGKTIDQLRAEATAKDGIRRIGTPHAVSQFGEGAAHPGHGDRRRWRRNGGVLLSGFCHHRAAAKRRVPVIPLRAARLCPPHRDGRDRPGHDGVGRVS